MVISFLSGLLPDGNRIPGPPFGIKGRIETTPLPEFELRVGRQGFGSGGYYASWTVWGDHKVLSQKPWDDRFTHGVTNSVRVTFPIAVVLQREGDAIGEGRSQSYAVLCIPEDELAELEDKVIRDLDRMSLDEIRELSQRPIPSPKVREAVEARLTHLWAKAQERANRLAWARQEKRRAQAMHRARQYAGDEATAASIAHLFE